MTLHWLPNHETDLAGYRLHRGNAPGFVPGSGNLIATLSDAGSVDHPGDQAGAFYKLAAIADPHLQATLYRSQANGPWQTITTLGTGGDGLIRYQDRDVTAGARYDYRLGAWDADHEIYFGEVSVSLPALSFSIGSLRPNPSGGRRDPGLQHRGGGNGASRRARRRRPAHAGPGSRDPSAGRWTLALDEAARWPAGVYAVRLRQGPQTVGARLVVSR